MVTTRISQRLFHLVCVKHYSMPDQLDYEEEYFQQGFASTKVYLSKLGGKLAFEGRTVMDLGCGLGSTCFYLACHGARRVVGVDVDCTRMEFARSKLGGEYAELAGLVQFRYVEELGPELFDVIISKDSFEHITDPEAYITEIVAHMRPGGHLAIGFGPIWKSPYGGHIDYMTHLPWAHLLFPEPTIMRERRRFRPNEVAETFEQIVGGLNKMTLGRFNAIMRSSGLEEEYYRCNVKDGLTARACDVARRIPPLREYFTFNVYTIWRKPADAA
jgi:SAM-dependent methyltransferase